MGITGATPIKIAAAYLAGYFDGEGCITVDSGLRLLVTATYPQSCLGLKEAFGGRVVRRTSRPGEKIQYQWTVYGKKAYAALEAIGNLLHEKRNQALYAMLWYQGNAKVKAYWSAQMKMDKHVSWTLPEQYSIPPEPIYAEV